jgi:hypothetical protein
MQKAAPTVASLAGSKESRAMRSAIEVVPAPAGPMKTTFSQQQQPFYSEVKPWNGD